MPFSPSSAPTSSVSNSAMSSSRKSAPEIITIPEKFYGVALRMDGLTQAERDTSKPQPSSSKPVPPPPPIPTLIKQNITLPPPRRWPLLASLIGLLIVIVGVVLVWRGPWLKNTVVSTPLPLPPPPIPASPVNLSAISSGIAVLLSWADAASNETGFRVERSEASMPFAPLTVLPANSGAFLDVSVVNGRDYGYRVLAFGDGGESAPSNEVQASVASATSAPVIALAANLPPGGLDSDSDGLSDTEEVLYGTSPTQPDVDHDSFLDGNEVFHLYNPVARSPVRLLDSGMVKMLNAPLGWSIYMPTAWTGGLDMPDGSQATLSTGSGETFVLRVEDNPTALDLAGWYLARHVEVSREQLHQLETKGGLSGIASRDRLETLFAWGNKVFRIQYVLGSAQYINYRTTYEMMLNSLKMIGVAVTSSSIAVTSTIQVPLTMSVTSSSSTVDN